MDPAKYPMDWKEISHRIRFVRAGGKCERCKAPHGKSIARADGAYMLEDGQTFDDETGEFLGYSRGSEFPARRFPIVILTCAHIDHDTQNNDESNFAGLCQRCHLLHDSKQHAESRRRNLEAASGQGRLFK